jgi:hypothetical protein
MTFFIAATATSIWSSVGSRVVIFCSYNPGQLIIWTQPFYLCFPLNRMIS